MKGDTTLNARLSGTSLFPEPPGMLAYFSPDGPVGKRKVATRTQHWRETAKAEPAISWQHRSELIAHLIRPNDVVCDLGAGAQTLRRYLPSSVGYIPVDCVMEHPDTWLADFNADFALPDRPFNVITCIGLLAHLVDRIRFLKQLAVMRPGCFIIFTTATSDAVAGYSNVITHLSHISTIRGRHTYSGTLGEVGSVDHSKRTVNDIICANTPILNYGRSRMSLATELLRRGGNSRTKRESA